jgi:hypothetical protein
MAMKWHVNILALVATMVGLVAVFLAWVDGGYNPDYDLIDILNSSFPGLLVAGCWLFLIGAVICCFSPIGGVLEIVGVALYFSWFLPEFHRDMPDPVGPYIGIASAIIAIASMVKPLVMAGYTDASPGIKERLFIFSSVPKR